MSASFTPLRGFASIHNFGSDQQIPIKIPIKNFMTKRVLPLELLQPIKNSRTINVDTLIDCFGTRSRVCGARCNSFLCSKLKVLRPLEPLQHGDHTQNYSPHDLLTTLRSIAPAAKARISKPNISMRALLEQAYLRLLATLESRTRSSLSVDVLIRSWIHEG